VGGLLYYFPNDAAITTPEDIPEKHGLSEVLGGASFSFCDCHNGPDGGKGRIVAAEPAKESGGSASRPAYFKDKQQWQEVSGLHWVGFNKNDPPNPADLLRGNPCDGDAVRLRDGNPWLIPHVYFYCSIPTGFSINGDNKWSMVLSPKYQKLVDRTEVFYTQAAEQGEMPKYLELIGYCCDVLAVNYRVGPHEVSQAVLDLFGTEMLHLVLHAALNMGAVQEEIDALKKSEGILSATPST